MLKVARRSKHRSTTLAGGVGAGGRPMKNAPSFPLLFAERILLHIIQALPGPSRQASRDVSLYVPSGARILVSSPLHITKCAYAHCISFPARHVLMREVVNKLATLHAPRGSRHPPLRFSNLENTDPSRKRRKRPSQQSISRSRKLRAVRRCSIKTQHCCVLEIDAPASIRAPQF